MSVKGECAFRTASIDGGEMTLWVNFCRAISRNARLLYPPKLSRRPFAIEAVTGQQQTSSSGVAVLIELVVRGPVSQCHRAF
jgi:hypothetical protein